MTRAAEAAFAPAKINLSLHVTGRRDDGYHLLDSLVVFADLGDRVRVTPGRGLRLTVTGPRAAEVPAGGDNLVLRAAALFADVDAAIELEKHLPVASGIGGGSSDAAAAMRALATLGYRPAGSAGAFAAATLALGADIPVCLAARPLRMEGVGEVLSRAPAMPPLGLVLANCGEAVPTRAVFATLGGRFGPPMPRLLPHAFDDAAALAAWLAADTRNDLEPPALTVAPEIGACLAALAALDGCLLARMSGSGATCFGLFADRAGAEAAAVALATAHPGWWVRAAGLWEAPSPG